MEWNRKAGGHISQSRTRMRALYAASLAAFAVLGVAIGIWLQWRYGFSRAWKGYAAPLYLLILPIVHRLFRLKPAYLAEICLYAFIFVAYDLGVALGLYGSVPYIDKIVHGASGVVFAYAGLCVYCVLSADKPRGIFHNPGVSVGFSFCFAMMTAGVWEVIEFVGFLLTGHDSQNVAATGVGDTMWDIISCMIGSLLACSLFAWYMRRRCRCLLLRPVEDFFETNWGDIHGLAGAENSPD